jgi:hypothetical protein
MTLRAGLAFLALWIGSLLAVGAVVTAATR